MEFRIKQFKKPKITEATMITGFPGIGNVGKIAIDFLIDHLKPEKIMEISSDNFPHSVFVTEQGLLELPLVRIFYKKVKNKEFVLVTGDAQPITEEGCYAFCNKLLNIAKDLNCKEIITMGGIGLGKIPKKPKAYIAGNNKAYIKGFPNCNIKIYGVVGIHNGSYRRIGWLGKGKEHAFSSFIGADICPSGLSWSKGSKGIIGCP